VIVTDGMFFSAQHLEKFRNSCLCVQL